MLAKYARQYDQGGTMAQLTEPTKATEKVADSDQSDRRRPGRSGTVSPALIPLLRRDSLIEGALTQRDGDDSGPARGIALGVVIGALLWAALALLVYRLFAG